MLIQESLGQIGIKTTINKIPGANFRTELNKKVLPLYLNVFSGWLDYPEYFFIWCYHGKNSIFNTMSYQSKEMDAMIDGAVDAAAVGDKADYDKDVKGFVDLAFTDLPRIPLFQPYSNVAMQKNISGYQYWFHRRLDYRALVEEPDPSFRGARSATACAPSLCFEDGFRVGAPGMAERENDAADRQASRRPRSRVSSASSSSPFC